MERFTGLIIEHFESKFPAWIAPGKSAGSRFPKRPWTRRSQPLERVPCMLVLGAREIEEGTVSVRHRDNEGFVTKSLEDFISDITTEIRNRSL